MKKEASWKLSKSLKNDVIFTFVVLRYGPLTRGRGKTSKSDLK
jgi:hypothetical protein